MGSDVSKEKKHMLTRASGLIQKKFKRCEVFQKNFNTSRTQSDSSQSSNSNTGCYATWPSFQLQETIQDLVVHLNKEVSIVSWDMEEIEHELNTKCPLDFDEQLDFCMLCHETDHIEAVELQEQLCYEYDLIGKVLWDCIPLGEDVFNGFERILNNSTKLLFYLTQQFNDADPCAHLARNLLIGQNNDSNYGKVIPIVNNFNTPIPETFQLVDKLYLCSKLQFRYRFPAVFSVDVRNEKLMRAKQQRNAIDAERKSILLTLIKKRLNVT